LAKKLKSGYAEARLPCSQVFERSKPFLPNPILKPIRESGGAVVKTD